MWDRSPTLSWMWLAATTLWWAQAPTPTHGARLAGFITDCTAMGSGRPNHQHSEDGEHRIHQGGERRIIKSRQRNWGQASIVVCFLRWLKELWMRTWETWGVTVWSPLFSHLTLLLTSVSLSVVEKAGQALVSCLPLTCCGFKGSNEYTFLRTSQT